MGGLKDRAELRLGPQLTQGSIGTQESLSSVSGVDILGGQFCLSNRCQPALCRPA